MKCAKIVDARKLEICDIEEPKETEGFVMVGVTKTGICGSDLHYFDMG